jgi:post-segregation antitoxin (ccd killing protein)
MPVTATATVPAPKRKRAVNLTLNEDLVEQAKVYTRNLSATMETLLADYVAQQQSKVSRQQLANACADDWNVVHASVGSSADEHSTL